MIGYFLRHALHLWPKWVVEGMGRVYERDGERTGKLFACAWMSAVRMGAVWMGAVWIGVV